MGSLKQKTKPGMWVVAVWALPVPVYVRYYCSTFCFVNFVVLSESMQLQGG